MDMWRIVGYNSVFVTECHSINVSQSKNICVMLMWLLVRLLLSNGTYYGSWMGDCLQSAKPSRYITQHQHRVLACLAGVKVGHITCVGWQVARVVPYGRWHSVALWWVSHKKLYTTSELFSTLYIEGEWELRAEVCGLACMQISDW